MSVLLRQIKGFIRQFAVCCGLCILAVFFSSLAFAHDPSRDIIVKWHSMPPRLDTEIFAPEVSLQIERVAPALPCAGRVESGLNRIAVLRMSDDADMQGIISQLREDERIEYVEQRIIRTVDARLTSDRIRDPIDGFPNDPFYAQQWGLHQIEIESAWDISTGDPSVVIAVVDIGVDFSHPELTDRRWVNEGERNGVTGVDDDGNGYVDDINGYDFVDNDGDPTPFPRNQDESHGTHVAGIAAATRNNNRGIAGTAPNCRVMGVRIGQLAGLPYGYEGIYYAWRAGARIINCSWGGGAESQYERDVIQFVTERGAIVVASAGNGNTTVPHFPAALEGTLSVAATRWGDVAAQFTHYGPWVQLCAPGVQILSTKLSQEGAHDYAAWDGTSMAAPFVSGLCALVASQFPSNSGREIAAQVIASCDPIDHVNTTKAGGLGTGRINAFRALSDSVPGLRVISVGYDEHLGNGDGRIRAGEQAFVRVGVHNELSQIEDVRASVTTTEDSIIIMQPSALYGSIGAGETRFNTTPFIIELPTESVRGRMVPLAISFQRGDGRLIARATTMLHLDSTFVVVQTARWSLGFAENGSLGYDDYVNQRYVGTGLTSEQPVPSGALFHGSFILAADQAVSDNAYGDAQFDRFDWVSDTVAHFIPSSRADVEARTIFEDRASEYPLYVKVTASALAWNDEAASGVHILEYSLFNRTLNTYDSVYSGFFLDWDVGPASRNQSHYDNESGIAFVSSTVSGDIMAGVAPISGSFSSYSAIDNRVELDPPAVWSDSVKWARIQTGMNASSIGARDISQLVTVGPFAIPSHESVVVSFALLTGHSLDELESNLLLARQRYQPASEPTAPAPKVPDVRLYPNPLPAGESLTLEIPRGGKTTARFYNLLGREIARFDNARVDNGKIRIQRTQLGLASGLLFYRIELGDERHFGKLLLLN